MSNDKPTINEVIVYISELVKDINSAVDQRNDKNIGYQMASVMSLENSDELCEDENLDDLISIVGVLEIPSADIVSRNKSWQEILSLLSKLESRYNN